MTKQQHSRLAWALRVIGAVMLGLYSPLLAAGIILLMIGNNMYIERLRPVVLDPRAAAPKDSLASFTPKCRPNVKHNPHNDQHLYSGNEC